MLVYFSFLERNMTCTLKIMCMYYNYWLTLDYLDNLECKHAILVKHFGGLEENPSIKIGTIFLCLTTHLFPFLTDDPRAAIEVQLLCIFRYFVCISIHHRVNSRRLRIETHHHIIAVIISLFSINAADRSILSGIMDENDRVGSAARIAYM